MLEFKRELEREQAQGWPMDNDTVECGCGNHITFERFRKIGKCRECERKNYR